MCLLPFDAIAAAFLRLRPSKRTLVQVVEDIRNLDEVRPLLPGNDERHTFVGLGQTFEREVAESLDYNASQPVLALDPEWCQRAFAALADSLEGLQGNVALLATNPAIRPFARKFVGLQYPHLWILSRRELLPGLSARVKRTVTLA